MRRLSIHTCPTSGSNDIFSSFETNSNVKVLSSYFDHNMLHVVFEEDDYCAQSERERVSIRAFSAYSSNALLASDEKFLNIAESRFLDLTVKSIDQYGNPVYSTSSSSKSLHFSNESVFYIVYYSARRIIGEIVAERLGILDENGA